MNFTSLLLFLLYLSASFLIYLLEQENGEKNGFFFVDLGFVVLFCLFSAERVPSTLVDLRRAKLCIILKNICVSNWTDICSWWENQSQILRNVRVVRAKELRYAIRVRWIWYDVTIHCSDDTDYKISSSVVPCISSHSQLAW